MASNLRNSFFGQKGPQSIVYDVPTIWHLLEEDGHRWMSDWPVEHRQMDKALRGMKGRVLVGGLGLGLATTILARKSAVTEIVVVELAHEVIQLVSPYIRMGKAKSLSIINQDLLVYLEEYTGPAFDYAFYDIWASDGKGTFFDTVVPLHELSATKVKTRPVNWNEDIMRGQLKLSLHSRRFFLTHPQMFAGNTLNLCKPIGSKYHDWAVPFWQWRKEAQPNDAVFEKAASIYASTYGVHGWQAIVDKALARWGAVCV